jgi:transcription elongation factor Elf1
VSEYLRFECRKCGKVTDQLERIVTDNLPPNVKVLECSVCGIMGVCLLEATDVPV